MAVKTGRTDDDIINSIPGLDDDDGGSTTATEGSDATTSTEEGETEQTGADATTAQSGDRGGSNTDGTTQQQTGKGQQQPAQQAQPNTARPGDLTDGQGRVVARAGAERRFYESWHRERQQHANTSKQLQTQTAELNTLRGRVQTLEQVSNAPQQHGLNPSEGMAAVKLFAQFKANPVGTLKYLLGEVQAMGHNVDGLSDPSVNMHSIGRMIDQRLQPVTERAEQERREQQARDDAANATRDFYTRYPDAHVHDAAIGALCERDPQLSPDAAYWMLKSHFASNGLDWATPLEQHNASRQRAAQGANGQQQPQQQQRQPTGRTLPNGRGGAVVQQQQQGGGTADQLQLADENDSWEQIIRNSMRTAGMRG